jgi:glycosyltransferase involved in cell wall biosynthesis
MLGAGRRLRGQMMTADVAADPSSISVVVPTYRRPLALALCLEGLVAQTRPADEVLLVLRDNDEETRAYLTARDWPGLALKTITVSVPGHVAAKNAGLEAATGDMVACLDDDAVPRPRWLELIEEHLRRDSAIAVVGGRDWLHIGDDVVDDVQSVIGRLAWFGRLQGRHHLGAGPPREVDTLRGNNMGIRRAALGELRFDSRLRGMGFQPHDDVAFCLALKHQGWKIFYDPEVAIDHYPGRRLYEQREGFDFTPLQDFAHNETIAVLPNVSLPRRLIYLAYVLAVGSKAAPGLLQVPRLLAKRERKVPLRFLAAMAGRTSGLARHLRRRDGSESRALPAPASPTTSRRLQRTRPARSAASANVMSADGSLSAAGQRGVSGP